MGQAIDDRGVLSFINDIDLSKIKRVYAVENFSTDTVRAFHGHQKEEKYVLVVKGSIILVTAMMASGGLISPTRKILSDRNFSINHIPGGYANGFRALEQDTKVLFFSTATLEESMADDFRYPHDFFGGRIWEAENR